MPTIPPKQQWLIDQLTPVISSNNPGAPIAGVTGYAFQISTFYLGYILPYLVVTDSITGATGTVSFNPPVSGG